MHVTLPNWKYYSGGFRESHQRVNYEREPEGRGKVESLAWET